MIAQGDDDTAGSGEVADVTGVMTDIQQPEETVALPSASTPMALAETASHDLDSILSRPVQLYSGNWDSNTSQIVTKLPQAVYNSEGAVPMLTFDFPRDIVANSALINDKLSYFKFFRADLEIELKVNSNQFQQGSLLMVYNPYEEYVTKFRRHGTRFLASQTSLPHAILSLESGSSMKMRVPYANIYDYFDLSDDTAQFGTINIYVLTALRGSTDAEKAGLVVFGRFISPEWYTPAQFQTTETSSDAVVDRYIDSRYKALALIDRLKQKYDFDASEMVAQAESEARTVAGLGSTVANGVHSLVKGLGWVARAAHGAATLLGLSKPTDTVMPMATVNLPGRYMANTEGKDYSVNLAQLPDNAVDGSAIIPATTDEMDLATLFGREHLFSNLAVDSSAFIAGNLLTSWSVGPFTEESVDSSDGVQSLYLGIFSYTALLYRYWRGSLRYSVHLVKTAYHSGRFALVFLPGAREAPTELGDLLNTCYNVVYDIQSTPEDNLASSFRFEVPYTSNEPWKSTLGANLNNQLLPGTADNSTGMVAMYAVTDLIHPETVSSSIDVLLGVSGGSDFSVAVPSMQLAAGYAPGVIGPSEINEWFITTFSSQAWKVSEKPTEGALVQTVFADQDLAHIEFGKSFTGALGTTVPGLTGGYTTDVMRCAMTIDDNPETSAVVDTIVFAQFIDGICVECLFQTPIRWAADYPGGSLGTSTAEVVAGEAPMIAQADSGILVPPSRATDVAAATMGEYTTSLRALMRRFSLVFYTPQNETRGYTPHMTQNDQVLGTRNVGQVTKTRIPESHYSLVSYLYRFYVGGSRLKVFNRALGGHTMCSLAIANDRSMITPVRDPTPVIEQSTIINNCTEVTIPYYGQTRCYVLAADQVDSKPLSRAVFTPSGQDGSLVSVYEAGADDLTFFFLVGPPVMHYSFGEFITPPIVA